MKTPLFDFDVFKKHVNAQVEARAIELEAFILAQLRVSGINPIDVCLVQQSGPALGEVRYYLEVKPRA